MNYEVILKTICVIVGIFLIVVVLLQRSQQSGLIGDVTNAEHIKKRGFELFLYHCTIIGIIILFGCALLYGMGIGGAF